MGGGSARFYFHDGDDGQMRAGPKNIFPGEWGGGEKRGCRRSRIEPEVQLSVIKELQIREERILITRETIGS